MIYQSEGKYYIKLSGYLIEVIPYLKGDDLDFKTTENKIEITSDLQYKAVNMDDIKNELKSGKKEKPQISEEFGFEEKPKKMSEHTHNKYKFKD